jgi:tetratricopeptide (TPR) repeat protein
LYAGRNDEVVELLAYHFGRSTEDEDAVDYAILAADKAQRRWANTETLAHLEVARQRLETMPDTASNRLRQIDAVLKQGEVQFALGRHVEHIESLEGIRTLVAETADPRRRATWYYWMGFLHTLTGSRPEVAIAYCREAAAIADTGGFDDIRAFAEACLAQVHVFAGTLWEAVATGERALATFEASGNIWWACRALSQLSPAANLLGDWRRSLEYCRRVLEHGLAVDDLRLKVIGWWRTGSTHIQQGDAALGLQCCEAALALSPTPFDVAMIQANRGRALVKVGQVERGIAELAAAVAWFEQSHLCYTRSLFALWLGDVYLSQGKWFQARALAEEILATCQEAGYRHLAGVAERCLGESLMAEDLTAAARHLEAAVQILEEVGARNEVAKALVAQAKLHQKAGDVSGARCLLERALTLFETLGTLDEPHRVQALLATLQDHR